MKKILFAFVAILIAFLSLAIIGVLTSVILAMFGQSSSNSVKNIGLIVGLLLMLVNLIVSIWVGIKSYRIFTKKYLVSQPTI